MERNLIIGIDFGTSTTVIKYRYSNESQIHPVKDPCSKNSVIPSRVFHITDKTGKITQYFGDEAESICNKSLLGTIRLEGVKKLQSEFKMALKYDRSSEEFRSKEQIIDDFFKFVFKTIYDTVLFNHSYKDVEVYLSVPAKWNTDACKIMKEKFLKAGFADLKSDEHNIKVETINEPTAAMYFLLGNNWKLLQKNGVLGVGRKTNCLLLDMGAGTSDISIFQIGLVNTHGHEVELSDVTNIKNYPRADNSQFCGGREMDALFSEYLKDKIKEHFGNEFIEKNKKLDQCFSKFEIKEWKERVLSRSLADEDKAICTELPGNLCQTLSYCVQDNDHAKLDSFITKFAIERKDFEAYTSTHWSQLNNLIMEAIKEYNTEFGVSAADIDLILLTGGHSSWYCVRNLFNGTGINGIGRTNGFTKIATNPELRISSGNGNRPSETVAEGMCMQNQSFQIPYINTNNIFIKLNVGEFEGSPVQIVQSGEELPIKKEGICSQEIILTKALYSSHKFDVNLQFYEGTAPTPDCWKPNQFKYESNSFGMDFGRLFAWLFFCNPNISYKFQVSVNIEIGKDNLLTLEGNLLVDGKVKRTFTEKDLEAANID